MPRGRHTAASLDESRAEAALMRVALRLAARGAGLVEPNPLVGCVLARNGKIIGTGWHRRFGGPHAEIEALRNCKQSPRGATAYVTLEPCCHHGKTPPCTDALIQAGVARVVAAQRDPFPRVAGRGLRQLRRAGIQTQVGLLADEAAALNAPYLKRLKQNRPWVILKWAQSLDGKIAARTGDAKWISDETMRAHAHRMRGRVDAILVGVGTVLADDPLLTCRAGRPRRIATRVVLDTYLRTPPTAQLVRTARQIPTWIFCGPQASAARQKILEQRGCVVRRGALAPSAQGELALPAILKELGRHSMTNILVEGGGRLLGSFFDQRLADELHVYVAPLLIGGHAAPGALNGRGPARVRDAPRLPATAALTRLGDGWFLPTRLSVSRKNVSHKDAKTQS